MPSGRVQHPRWMHGPKHDLRLAFREQTFSLSTFYTTSCVTSFSFVSYPILDGPGSHFARFLHALGEGVMHVLDKVVIHARLMTIARRVGHPAFVYEMDKEGKYELRYMCDDLLELCSPRYSLKLRRKALGLLLALIKPIDARSTFLLESNFMILLASFELESCKDTVVQRHSADVVALYESYHELPCKCAVCLANLRSKLRIWDKETTALYDLFQDRRNHETRMNE